MTAPRAVLLVILAVWWPDMLAALIGLYAAAYLVGRVLDWWVT